MAPSGLAHVSSILWNDRDALTTTNGATNAPERAAGAVTYQDPCRLGRHVGLYDPPRELLTEVAGAKLLEMEHSRERSICCGNTAWLNCNAGVKRLQVERLGEAQATGAARLLTACPGCYIHLRCAQEGMAEDEVGRLPIEDLWTCLADALPADNDGARRDSTKKGRKQD